MVLRKKYPTDKEFSTLLQLTGEMDAQMVEIDSLLCDEKLFELIEADLSERYPQTTKTGRGSTPVEVILRMLALKHLRDLSYEKTIQNVNESLVLRQFCRVYFQTLPHKSTLIRWSNQIREETLNKFNQRLTQIARQQKITKGIKMRTDGTVVASNIHYPSDNSLLGDSVKVISRLLSQTKEIIPNYTLINSQVFRHRNRTARKISREIDKLSTTRNKWGRQKREKLYLKLINVTKASLEQAKQVEKILKTFNSPESKNIRQKLVIFIPRIQQVIQQTSRRILEQEKVPASEKIVSIFEAHTDIICRGKLNKEVEFGHKVWLDEVDGGIVSNYRILKGNPHDTQQLVDSLDQHLKIFGHPPKIVTADRGVYSQSNEKYAQKLEIKQVILPKGGYRNQERVNHERRRTFKKGRRWHNGVEGRISFLKRCFGLQRCLYRNYLGFQRWVAWGVVAHNLTIISRGILEENKKSH